MTLFIFLCLPFFYKHPIILNLLKIGTLNRTMYILTILTWSLEMYATGKLHFHFFKCDCLILIQYFKNTI